MLAPGVHVALVLVSHSRSLADGLVELAAQMAPDVTLLAAGGLEDGGLGTSYDRVETALREALGAVGEGGAVVVLADLGSAVLTVESVLEIEDDLAEQVSLVAAPFVEGTVAAAVAAQGGAARSGVARAATDAASGWAVEDVPADDDPGASAAGAVRRAVVVRNPLGLHARPAALLARLASGFDARTTIGGVDGSSVLAVLQLGVTGGRELEIAARGPQAEAAVAAVVEAIETGFGEA